MTSSGPPSTLPAMSTEEAEHSRRVSLAIRERIEAAGGWLPFDEFMEMALYAPGLGYYTAGGVKIGRGGDFTTAPEVSDLFSTCVARQCSEALASGGSILELGAGTGRMASAVMTTLASVDCLPERYFILEVSADLRARQQERIGALPAEVRDRFVWLDALPERPMRGVIVANEVLDALPCQRVLVRDGRAIELGVGIESGGADIRFIEREAVVAGVDAWPAIESDLPQPLPDDYRTEICARVNPWIASLSDSLDAGLILLFDYGLPRPHYYHPQRTNGTLRCHFKQRAHDDPFINVGVQDVTAWVDFTRVAEAAFESGLEVSGFATQAGFLLGLGIEGMVTGPRLASEARQLMMPGEMGEVFKAMALTRNLNEPLSGFSVQDLRRSL
jgi:SAM-dependent MidA family methyltransferase